LLLLVLQHLVQGHGKQSREQGIRLRTNTIWFPVILHRLHDLALKYTNFPAIPLDVVQVTLLMIYGIYLLRGWNNSGA